MSKAQKLNYIKGIIIAHGDSELRLARYIKSNLHLPIKIYSKDNGKHSIQIDGLMNHLNNRIFRSKQELLQHYDYLIEQDSKSKEIINFFVMPIMDLDDCEEEEQRKYITKEMFKGHWLYPYITPIWNSPTLDHVLYQLKLIPKIPKDDEKSMVYSELFPINHKETDIEQIQELQRLFESSDKTNMEEFTKQCLESVEKLDI